MAAYTFLPKVITSEVTEYRLACEHREGLRLALTLRNADGTAHDGSTGALVFALCRRGLPAFAPLRFTGRASGLYTGANVLVIPTADRDGTYDYALWWVPAAGAPTKLYAEELRVAVSVGPDVTGDVVSVPDAVLPAVQQSVELVATLDLDGTAGTIPTEPAIRVPRGVATRFVVTCAQLAPTTGTPDPTATGYLVLSTPAGLAIGAQQALTQDALVPGRFTGSLPGGLHSLLAVHSPTNVGAYTVVLVAGGIPYVVRMPSPVTFVPTGIPANANPTVTMAALATTYAAGAIPIGGSALDEDADPENPLTAASFTALLDGAPMATQPTFTLTGTNWSASPVVTSAGAHVLGVTVEDSGHATTTVSRSTTVQTLAITSPVSGGNVDAYTATCAFLATPAITGTTEVQLYVDGAPSGIPGTVTGGATTGTLALGARVLSARLMWDGAQIVAPNVPVTVRAVPAVTLDAIPTVVPAGALAISGTASDADGPLTGANFGVTVGGVAQTPTFTYGAGNWSASVTMPPGEAVVVLVTVTDAQGLTLSASRSTRVQLLSIVTPSAGLPAVDEGPVVVTVAADPTVTGSTALQLYDGAATTGSAGTVAGGATTADLAAGTHQITGRITVGGIEIASAARAVLVADQLPVPVFASPAQGARVSEGAVTVLVDVTHASATPEQLVVEVSLDPTFASGVQTATWVSGVRWTASVTIAGQTVHEAYCRAHDSTTPTEWVSATPLVVNALPAYVRFTSLAGTYAPTVALAPGSTATVTWTCEETAEVQTTLTPSFTVTGTQHIRMSVSGNAFGDVRWVNHGFVHTDDRNPTLSLADTFNKASDPLAFAEYLGNLIGMTYWFAARTPCSNVLDFRGCAALTHVEMFRTGGVVDAYPTSGVTNVLLTGTAVARLCMERNRLGDGQVLDLNPVRSTLIDVRMAAQVQGTLNIAPLTGTGWIIDHWCTNSQYVLPGVPSTTTLPLCREWLTWNNGMRGAVVLNASCIQWDGNGDQQSTMGNRITSLDCSAVGASIHTVRVQSNAMTQAAVDSMLAQLVAAGMTAGAVDCRDTSAPSAAGLASVATLRGRGVTVDIVTTEADGVAQDLFTVALAAGWRSFAWDATGAVSAGSLQLRNGSGAAYDGYRVLANSGDGTVNATPNYEVELEIENSTFAGGGPGYSTGIAIRCKYLQGIAVRFTDVNSCSIGLVESPSDNSLAPTVVNPLPASWTAGTATRTLMVRVNGSTLDVFCDGVHCFTSTSATLNSTAQNSAFGVVGGGRDTNLYPSITARALAA